LLHKPFSIARLEMGIVAAAVEQAGENLILAAKRLGLARAQLAYRYRRSGNGDAEPHAMSH
jgi:transcriptional regulator with GAF, ATPase, and Fis domain